MKGTKISDVLKGKSKDVLTAAPGDSVLSAARRMTEQGVGSLIVLSESQPVGIVTERDCLRYLASGEGTAEITRVSDIMTRQLVAVKPEDSIEQGMAVMTEKRCRHLPVVQGSSLVGIVSIGDLVKQVALDQKADIHYLTEYILGNYPGVEARGTSVFSPGPPLST